MARVLVVLVSMSAGTITATTIAVNVTSCDAATNKCYACTVTSTVLSVHSECKH
jgi:hypothetical protein